MASHSKCSVKVTSSKGTSWTTRRGARRLVERGMAKEGPGGLVMVEADPRFACVAASVQRAQYQVIPRRVERHVKVLVPLGYLPYPQPGSFVRRKEYVAA